MGNELRRRRATWIAALLLAGVTGLAPAASDSSKAEEGGGGIAWVEDLEAAMEIASMEGRDVLASFYTGWCGWCRRLERETFVDVEVVRLSRQLVCVKIDGDRRKDLAGRYGVQAYPTIGILRSDGSPVRMERGYQRPGEFRAFLSRLLDSSGRELVLRERLKDHPQSLDLRTDLTRILLRRNEYAAAAEQLDWILRSSNELSDSAAFSLRLERARCWLESGARESAIPELEALARRKKGFRRQAEAAYFLAEASWRSGDRKKARSWFQKVLDLRPSGILAERSRERLAALGKG